MNRIKFHALALLSLVADVVSLFFSKVDAPSLMETFIRSGFAMSNTAVTADFDPAAFEALGRELKEKTSEFKTRADELGQMKTDILGRLQKGEDASKEFKEQVDKQIVLTNELKAQLQDIEQKMATKVKEQAEKGKTYGEELVASESYKSFKASGSSRGKFSVEAKALTTTTAAGLLRQPYRDEMVRLPRERFVVEDLIPIIPVQEGSVDYPVQSVRTNNAAPVAEGALKPTSDYAWTTANVPIRTLAHITKLSRQAVDDAPRLVAEVDAEMRYGLGLVKERQYLYGAGTGQNMHGIVPQAAAFAVPGSVVAGDIILPTRVDVLRLAMLQLATSLYPADGIVLNDLDWGLIELTKTTDGAYLFAQPQGSVGARMWGLPVVTTPAMVAGDFLVGAFGYAARIYKRMGVEVLISTENEDDFVKNMATMRAEERAAIGVKIPDGFITGDFASALLDIPVTP
jgi:HK97 family phage major capsid protein